MDEWVAWFLPSATVVAERLCFHRCLFVHSGGGVNLSGQTHTPQADTPRVDTPQADTPHLDNPQADNSPPRDGHCSGQYASYWNAFLYEEHFTLHLNRDRG